MVRCFATRCSGLDRPLLRSTGSHGTLLRYTLQWAGPALLRPTRSHGTLLCYTLQWAGPALLLQHYCSAALDGIAWYDALLIAPLCCAWSAAPCWLAESLALHYIAAAGAEIMS